MPCLEFGILVAVTAYLIWYGTIWCTQMVPGMSKKDLERRVDTYAQLGGELEFSVDPNEVCFVQPLRGTRAYRRFRNGSFNVLRREQLADGTEVWLGDCMQTFIGPFHGFATGSVCTVTIAARESRAKSGDADIECIKRSLDLSELLSLQGSKLDFEVVEAADYLVVIATDLADKAALTNLLSVLSTREGETCIVPKNMSAEREEQHTC